MGPSLFSDGNTVAAQKKVLHARLQWGRRYSATEMPGCKHSTLPSVIGFNGAVAIQRRKFSNDVVAR